MRPRVSATVRILAICLIWLPLSSPEAPAQTMGLLQNDPGAYAGYTLFETLTFPATYLINNEGRLVHSWTHSIVTGNMAYIQPNGDLVRCADPGGNPVFLAGGDAGKVQRLDWDGNLLWDFLYSDSTVRAHHDIAVLPNGNVLVLAWELKTAAEAIAAGRDPAFLPSNALWPEHVVEVEPVGATGGNIVWEWHLWDHLIQDFDPTKDNFGVVGDHPELLDINFFSTANADWIHANAIDYNADLDQILINSPFLNELYIIDHSTTTAEAAGHTGGAQGRGGDILYRWGNPRAYRAGTTADQKFFGQHNAHWIEPGKPGAGNILVYNNGAGRPAGAFSTVEEIVTTVDPTGSYPVPASGTPHGPAAPIYTYTGSPPTSFFSSFISGAERLPNGNTLLCEGASGEITEVDPTDTIVWRYINPVNAGGPMMQGNTPTGNLTFRANRYPLDFAGFVGRDLTPGPPIEIYETTDVALLTPHSALHVAPASPNPFRRSTQLSFYLPQATTAYGRVVDVSGRTIATLFDGPMPAGDHRVAWTPDRSASGVYYFVLRTERAQKTQRMLLVR